jgi:heat shock protein HslJ
MQLKIRVWIAITAVALAACGAPAQLPADLDGTWRVQQIAGASLGEGVRISFDVDAQTGTLTGFTGCNDFTASMSGFGEAISIGAPSEAPGSCPNAAAATDEARFLGVLSSVRRFIRHGRSLELLGAESGEALLRLRAEDEAPSQQGS